MLAPYLRKVAELSSAMGATHLLRDIPHCQRNETLSQMAKFDRTTSGPSCFISERVAMWQSHWQPRRSPLSHKDLRCVEYFANLGKIGKELRWGSYSNCPASKWPREKVSRNDSFNNP